MSTYLKSVSTSSGFLEKCPIEFGPGLTCIIGARGTCKSTLIESIRFAFESDEQRVATVVGNKDKGDASRATFGIMKNTLGAGSVRCTVEHKDGDSRWEMTVEREEGSEPRIFVDGVREHTSRDLLRRIEVFSQGDLQRIAEDENDEERLTLIDRPHRDKAARLKANRQTNAEKLRQLGPKLRSIRGHLSTLNHEIAQLAAYRAHLDQLEKEAPPASPELEAERQGHDRRQHALETVKSIEEERADLVERLAAVRSGARGITESISTLTDDVDGMLGNVSPLKDLTAVIAEMLTAAKRIDAVSLGSFVDGLERRFEEESERYYQLRQQEQAVNESLKQQQALRRQVEHLENQTAKADDARAQETELLKQRHNLRGKLQEIDDELFEMRIAEIDSINRDHGDTVQLTLGSSSSHRAYAARLSELLSGSRIRSQEEVARLIAESIEPRTLIDLIETGDSKRLADLLGRDLGQMTRVIVHLSDHEELYGLETELPAARLEVTLFDEGVSKPVETLSKGQRATALLPIILRPLPYPLLFDQPEDDLDNNFIFKSLIATLRTLKSQRQLIFVTHNANIPVVGVAEKVVVMTMAGPNRAAPAMIGSVDSRKQQILDLLEGGAEAFVERERYYRELLAASNGETAGSANVRA